MNFDASLIIGHTWDNRNRSYPFIWSPSSGLRNLRPVLDDVFGLADELQGWGNLIASDMSWDGRYLIGTGINPFGQNQGWLIDLGETIGSIPPGVDTPPPPYVRPVPEPATFGWMAVISLTALIVLRSTRVRSRVAG